MSDWTTGRGTQTLTPTTGPTRTETLAAEIAAENKSEKTQTVRRSRGRIHDIGYQRPKEAQRGETLQNQIRSLERTDPRNRFERRQKRELLQCLRKELNG